MTLCLPLPLSLPLLDTSVSPVTVYHHQKMNIEHWIYRYLRKEKKRRKTKTV